MNDGAPTGLRERPAVPDDVRRAVQAAVDSVVAAARVHESPTSSPWRFSGRWFSAHPVRTRSRPG